MRQFRLGERQRVHIFLKTGMRKIHFLPETHLRRQNIKKVDARSANDDVLWVTRGYFLPFPFRLYATGKTPASGPLLITLALLLPLSHPDRGDI